MNTAPTQPEHAEEIFNAQEFPPIINVIGASEKKQKEIKGAYNNFINTQKKWSKGAKSIDDIDRMMNEIDEAQNEYLKAMSLSR